MISELKKILNEFGLAYFKRYYACYRGIVHDNEDPKNYGRLILSVPQIHGKKIHEYWAWPKGMFAGKDIGFYAIPNKGDGVWVSFEEGNPRYPIWEYGWWAKDQVPKGASIQNKVFQTTTGHRLEFDDEHGRIRITAGNGQIVEINKTGISLGSADKSKEPVLLGDTTVALLKEILVGLEQAKVTTLAGPMPLLNLATFTAIKQKLESLKSKIVTLD